MTRARAGPAARSRLSADERRDQIVDIALAHFSRTGLHGTPTDAIAREAGISHAYLFRLFRTKKELFLACAARMHTRTIDTFRAAAAAWEPSDELPTRRAAMGSAYIEMLADRELLLMQMQVWAACSDEEIRAAASEGYRAVFEEIERLTGDPPDDVRAFMATGMLLNVAAALRLEELAPDADWVCRLLPHTAGAAPEAAPEPVPHERAADAPGTAA